MSSSTTPRSRRVPPLVPVPKTVRRPKQTSEAGGTARSSARRRSLSSADSSSTSSESTVSRSRGTSGANALASLLEEKLSEACSELEEVREKLEDRELEVHILQKRLSLRDEQNQFQTTWAATV